MSQLQPAYSKQKHHFTFGFQAGLIAGIIATILMLLLSVTIDGISLPEAFGSALTQLMPPPLFDFLHQLIGGDAKHYFFYIILVGQCLVFGLVGGLYNLLSAPSHRSLWLGGREERLYWFDGVLLALILWLFTGFLFLPISGAGIFGAQLTTGLSTGMVSLAITGLAYGLLYILIQNWLVQRGSLQEDTQPEQDETDEADKADESRRTILRRGLAILGIGTLGVLAWRFISGGTSATPAPIAHLAQHYKKKITPPPQPDYGDFHPVNGLSSEVTSNADYYIVSKNLLSDPTVNGSSWKLQVSGAIEKPYTLNYQELLALPMKKQYESMMCISNEVGGPYMSNALWEGIPLANLLQQAGSVKPGATKVVLHAYDDYSDSIHLSKALEPTTLLAVRMNGATLPQGHGYPARLLVPGIYGMKHVKWVTGIEVVNTDYQGYWQQRGWSDPAPIRLTARIDTPLPDATLVAHHQTYIAGVAFSGNKGISQVNVSFDGGNHWQSAILKRPLSDLTWVLWEIPWQPTPGTHTLVAYAVDMEGNVQDPASAPPLPDGSSGYHNLNIQVR